MFAMVAGLFSPSFDRLMNYVVRIAKRSWLSYEIMMYVYYILLDEVLGQPVRLVANGNSELVLQHLAKEHPAVVYEVDVENWQINEASSLYRDYVLTDKKVIDVGSTGYDGRSGIHLGPTSFLDSHELQSPDWWRSHKNEFIFEQFPPTGTDLFPDGNDMCDRTGVDWCENGRYIPPSCKGGNIQYVGDTAVSPTLTPYSRVLLSVQRDYPILFYYYTPDPILLQLDALRVAFPGITLGCDEARSPEDLELIRSPSGYVACDFGITTLHKLVSANLKQDAPAAFKTLQDLTLNVDEDLMPTMAKTAAAGGAEGLTTFQAACEWVTNNMPRVEATVPLCDDGFDFDPNELACVVKCAATRVPSEDRLSCVPCGVGKRHDLTLNVDEDLMPTMAKTAAAGGAEGLTTFQAACEWVTNNMPRVEATVPLCDDGFDFDPNELACVVKCAATRVPSEDRLSCVPCGVGYAPSGNPADTNRFCAPCRNGTYNDQQEVSECKVCVAGEYSVMGATECLRCGPGTYSGKGAAVCEPCAAGRFNPSFNVSECDRCPPGFISPPGATECSPCPPGFFNPLPKQRACRVCVCMAFAHECVCTWQPCNNEDDDSSGSSHLGFDCPAIDVTVTVTAGAGGNNTNNNTDTNTTLRTYRVAAKGFYKLNTTSVDLFFPCPLRDIACVGYDPVINGTICAEGHKGVLCNQCHDGWFKSSAETPCRPCPNEADSLSKIIFACLLVTVLVGILVRQSIKAGAQTKSIHAALMKILINYIQLAGVAFSLCKFALPPFIKALLTTVSRGSNDPTTTVLPTTCFMERHSSLDPAYIKVVVAFTLAPMAHLALSIIVAITYVGTRTPKPPPPIDDQQDLPTPTTSLRPSTLADARQAETNETLQTDGKLPSAMSRGSMSTMMLEGGGEGNWVGKYIEAGGVILVFLLHPIITSMFFDVLDCVKYDKYRLRSNLDIVCFEDEHHTWQMAAIAGIVCVSFGIPALCFIKLYRSKDDLEQPSVKERIGFLYNGLETGYYSFEGIYMVRKVLVIAITVLPGMSDANRRAVLLLFGAIFLTLHVACQPFDNRSYLILDSTETKNLWALLGTIILYLFQESTNADFLRDLAAYVVFGIHLNVIFGVLWGLPSTFILKNVTVLQKYLAHGMELRDDLRGGQLAPGTLDISKLSDKEKWFLHIALCDTLDRYLKEPRRTHFNAQCLNICKWRRRRYAKRKQQAAKGHTLRERFISSIVMRAMHGSKGEKGAGGLDNDDTSDDESDTDGPLSIKTQMTVEELQVSLMTQPVLQAAMDLTEGADWHDTVRTHYPNAAKHNQHQNNAARKRHKSLKLTSPSPPPTYMQQPEGVIDPDTDALPAFLQSSNASTTAMATAGTNRHQSVVLVVPTDTEGEAEKAHQQQGNEDGNKGPAKLRGIRDDDQRDEYFAHMMFGKGDT
ncbi:unnamed protein product [Vitrella brassicaformis CCMP3155]|uniref:Tyrosine-protein kinase ephrin type A/B receptor-like domain-containing protein n=1 Tax=Vitrella brassicaformis (strain CCMP3155) TaxID=1169540 RepID=A0A0G4EBT8_VITBC|nr:unnamed protein product [Vitrella brassicaformis CCMP3155]|eukprot:CEL92762.1 unnamed protein product [Vitrella brassicaformis CCMP3155]